MTIANSLIYLKQKLQHIYEESESQSIATWVLCSVTKQEWKNINSINNTDLTEPQLQSIENIIAELNKNKPVQYVLGESYFYNMQLYVNENVLIPRPETEELIDYIVQHKNISLQQENSNILDIGTGSGCIAIALKKVWQQANVVAIDLKIEALEVAKRNAQSQKVFIDFRVEDILSPQNDAFIYDLIISNPPYITEAEKEEMHQNVLQYEPHTALFVSNGDPLQFYKAILQKAKTNLIVGGYVFLELNHLYAAATQTLFQKNNFQTEIIKDMQGKMRFLQAKKL